MRRLLPFLGLFTSLVLGGCFPHHAGPRLAHFETMAPAIGEPAPNFVLLDLDGQRVELAELIGDRPIVLQLGSHSCPVYRYRRFSMSGLYEEFRDRVHFLLVYTVEAHPVGSRSPYAEGEWDPWWNRLTGVRVRQPPDGKSRRRQAGASHERLKLEPSMVVDEMDNAVWQSFGAASSPAFVIDRKGRIAVRQVWVEPMEIRQVLRQLLAEPSEGPLL